MSNKSLAINRNFQKKSIKEDLANYKKERSNFSNQIKMLIKQNVSLNEEKDGESQELSRLRSTRFDLLNEINSKKKTQLNKRNKTNDKYKEIQVDYF